MRIVSRWPDAQLCLEEGLGGLSRHLEDLLHSDIDEAVQSIVVDVIYGSGVEGLGKDQLLNKHPKGWGMQSLVKGGIPHATGNGMEALLDLGLIEGDDHGGVLA